MNDDLDRSLSPFVHDFCSSCKYAFRHHAAQPTSAEYDAVFEYEPEGDVALFAKRSLYPRVDRSHIPIPYPRIGKREGEVPSPVVFSDESLSEEDEEQEKEEDALLFGKRAMDDGPVMIPMARMGRRSMTADNMKMVRARARARALTILMQANAVGNAGSGDGIRLTRDAGGIRLTKKALRQQEMQPNFQQIPMARLGKRSEKTTYNLPMPMARIGRQLAVRMIPVAARLSKRKGEEPSFQQIPMARMGRSMMHGVVSRMG
jgi:hypothetical protein